jgi:hypothetical protein
VNGVEPDLVLVGGGLGQRLARHDSRDAAEDLRQAGAAGVDDARLAEHLEVLRRSLDRLLGGLHELAEQVRDGRGVGREPLGRLGGLADNRQHRPLDGLPHGPVGGVAGAAQRLRDRWPVDRGRVAERLGGAADDLGEDDARVAARRHQRGARRGMGQLGPTGRLRGVERLDDPARGQR